MDDGINATTDFSSALAGLDQLAGPVMHHLARSMAVAGGSVIRDEAKANVRVGTEEGGSITPGLLKSAIYLAYKPLRSNASQEVYSISWNAQKAPQGVLQEFGHWEEFVTYRAVDGEWYSQPDRPLPQPVWVPARPFLGPALSARGRAFEAMIARGQQRLPELLVNPNSAGADDES
jgi:hypothetical protein